MTSRTSRLDGLLRVRRLQEEVARARLIADAAVERRAERALDEAVERYAAPAAEADGDLATPEFLAGRRRRQALAGSVRLAGTTVQEAIEVLDQSRTGWSDAAMRMTALERLEERAAEAARLERLAAEQRTIEDAGSAIRRDGAAEVAR